MTISLSSTAPWFVSVHIHSRGFFLIFCGCEQVCQRLYEVVNGVLELQYRIELGVDGVEPGHVSRSRNIEEQLSSLLRLRASWNTLSPSSGPFHSTISTGREPRSSLVHGVFASTFWDGIPHASVFRFEAMTIISSQDQPMKSLSSTSDASHQHTVFTTDPSQDLLVFVAIRNAEHSSIHISLRELSSGSEHPHAYNPNLSFQLSCTSVFARAEVANNVIAVFAFFTFHTGTVQVWDWNGGDLLVVSTLFRNTAKILISLCQGFEINTTFQDAVSLIAPHALVVASAEGHGSLDLYRFSRPIGSSVTGDVRELKPSSSVPVSSSGTRCLEHAARLQLPTTETGVFINEMRVRVGPYLTQSGRSGAPFISSPDSRIAMLTIHYTPAEPDIVEQQYTLVVHSRSLLRALRDGPAVVGAVHIVDWVRWGPHNTRLWENGPSRDFISS